MALETMSAAENSKKAELLVSKCPGIFPYKCQIWLSSDFLFHLTCIAFEKKVKISFNLSKKVENVFSSIRINSGEI